MNIIRRSAGSGVIFLAFVVLVLCFAGIIGVWSTKSRIDALGEKVFEVAEDSLAFMDEKLNRIEEAFKNGQRRVGLLSMGLDRIPQKAADAKAETTSLLKTLDEDVFEPLKTAQTWLDSTHAVALGVDKISEAVVSSKYAASHADSVGVAMAGQLQEFSNTVVEMLATLKEVRRGLIDIRDNVLSARRIAVMIVARLAQVEKRMANLCRRIETYHARVAEMKGKLAAERDRFQWWTTFGALLVTLLLAWFAASQIGMVLHGWSLVKRRPQ
jgi:DNA repair ATPase RecN